MIGRLTGLVRNDYDDDETILASATQKGRRCDLNCVYL